MPRRNDAKGYKMRSESNKLIIIRIIYIYINMCIIFTEYQRGNNKIDDNILVVIA